MRKALCVLTLLMLLSCLPVAAGTQNNSDGIEGGAIFGGASLAANASGAVEVTFSNLPSIAEDFTATWCDNCVYVEKALHNVSAETGAEVLHFHRNNDHQDPFGSESASAWWQQRYGTGIPPTVAFNGEELVAGSQPQGESLDADYTALIGRETELGQGDSQFTWTLAADNATGIFSWSLQYNSTHTTFSEGVDSWLFIIEDSANFPEGGNGVEDYPYIVHEVILLGAQTEGMTNITLPNAWDGNDLTLMLIHELPIIPVSSLPDKDSIEGGFLPSVTFVTTLAIVAIAATFNRK